jgi:hypothetical protein
VLHPLIRWVFRRDIRARLRGLQRGVEVEGLASGGRQSPDGVSSED